MNDFISKIPFFRLLLPAVVAIIVSAFAIEIPYTWIICCTGIAVMLVSCFISVGRYFSFRWVFGAGLFVAVFGLFAGLFQFESKQSKFTFPTRADGYIGTVLDIPQEKPRTIACNVQVTYPVNKKIVVYLQKNETAWSLNPGEEIVFFARIQPFKNLGNPDDFNYARFMRTKGFAGSTYLPLANWRFTGRERVGIYVLAQRFRKKALDFYRSFELSGDEYSFISSLTLGYKSELTNEMQEAFRASGTSHVLAVSGLHVGIVYFIFSFLFSFLGKAGRKFVFRQILIIVALWFYAFLTGLSPSVLRATIMLTIVSVGLAQDRKGFTYNTLAATAFCLLAYSPFNLFDVGFQMSFAAVFAILFFNPFFKRFYQPRQKAKKYSWELFTVSVSAQLGIFPIALYYFGTFPTYFFIANMLVVPTVGIIIYACIPMIFVALLKQLDIVVFDLLFLVFRFIFKLLINSVLYVVYFIESIPYSQFSDSFISAVQMFLLFVGVISIFMFFYRKRASQLIMVLVSMLLFIFTFVYAKLTRQPDKFAVFNKSNVSDIRLFVNQKRFYSGFASNGIIPHSEKIILRLSENFFDGLGTEICFNVDVLILSQSKMFSIAQLNDLFRPKIIILDSSLPRNVRANLLRDCMEMEIPVHDVVQDGAYLINL